MSRPWHSNSSRKCQYSWKLIFVPQKYMLISFLRFCKPPVAPPPPAGFYSKYQASLSIRNVALLRISKSFAQFIVEYLSFNIYVLSVCNITKFQISETNFGSFQFVTNQDFILPEAQLFMLHNCLSLPCHTQDHNHKYVLP